MRDTSEHQTDYVEHVGALYVIHSYFMGHTVTLEL